MSDTAFKPTTLRGRALLRHVFSIIEAEDEKAHEYGSTEEGKWDQGSWGHVETEGLRDAGVDFSQLIGDKTRDDGSRFTLAQIALDAGTVRTACGTACCFAGHASLAVGDQVLLSTPVDLVDAGYDRSLAFDLVIPVEKLDGRPRIYAPDSGADVDGVSVMERARLLLDLDPEEADMLFDSDNDIDEIRHMVDYLAEGRDVSACEGCGERPWYCDYEGDACSDCAEHTVDCECCPECGSTSADSCVCNMCPECGGYSEDDETCEDCTDDEDE